LLMDFVRIFWQTTIPDGVRYGILAFGVPLDKVRQQLRTRRKQEHGEREGQQEPRRLHLGM
jgi:hypothetical protein